MYDPLVHDYVVGKMIGGVLGLLIGIGLIIASCQLERSKADLPKPTPSVSYPCARWHVWDCELQMRVGEM